MFNKLQGDSVGSLQGDHDSKVLVSDFDGTMTEHDFYELALRSLLPFDTPDHWAEYRAGTVTHFEALRRYFAAIRGSEEAILSDVKKMNLDAELGQAVESLRAAGWEVIVTSAGCEWYIRHLLDEAGVNLKVHANPGRYVVGQGLLMEMPQESRFLSSELGVNKAGVVQHYLWAGRTVAFAGDGLPDVEPARLVRSDLRFARGDLANVLQEEGLSFHRYQSWSDIARTILSRKD